ncbi:MAG: sulfatase-like hydrolase/transferase [Spirochaetes bacterium]|nr:sulfatase-like hydrolase/transferase [Spirochaetota bacterium]
MLKKIILKIVSYKNLYMPGLLVSGALFLYAIIFNMSFSYMGNTSAQVVQFIIYRYKFLILFYFLKIIAVYSLIGIALSIFFSYGIQQFSRQLKFTVNNKHSFYYSALLTFAVVFLQLCKSIITYPQLYQDTIFNKNIVYKYFQIALTNNLSPVFIETIQLLFIAPFLVTFVISFFLSIQQHKDAIIDVLTLHFNIVKYAVIGIFIALIIIVTISVTISHKNIHDKPNIIILASDALRPDHFSGFGYHRNTTPHIDRLIAQGTTFNNVYTVVPRTFPAWVSILTSQLPVKHGISHMFPMVRSRNKKFITLATVLKEHGYRTAVIGDFAADIFPRINLGFDTVKAPTFNMRVMIKQIILKNHIFLLPFLTNRAGFLFFPEIREFAEFADPQFVVSDIKKEISSSISHGKPFFILSFFSITHFPYPACYPYYKTFTDTAYNGPFKYSKNRFVSLDSKGMVAEYQPSPGDIEHIRALYDGCLYAFDESVGNIIQYLKDNNLYDNTIIVIVSDHGENLYEFEYGMGHGEHLRGKYSLVIPCIFSGPGIGNSQYTSIRSAIDIAPTILDILHLPQPQSFDGTSLLKKHNRVFDAYCETGIWFDNTGNFFFQKKRIMYPDITGISTIDFDHNDEITVTPYYDNLITIAKHRCIIANNMKLIYMPTHYGIEYELYDVSKDPNERNNIYTTSSVAHSIKDKFFSLFKTQNNIKIYNSYIIPFE